MAIGVRTKLSFLVLVSLMSAPAASKLDQALATIAGSWSGQRQLLFGWHGLAGFGEIWRRLARDGRVFLCGDFFLGVFPLGFGFSGLEFVEMAGVCGQTKGSLGLHPRCWLRAAL
ncbi:MAG: hypothetical protein WD733_17120 [Bryobacterales bacterium]